MKARLYQLSGAGAGSYELVNSAGELYRIEAKQGGDIAPVLLAKWALAGLLPMVRVFCVSCQMV